MDASEDTHSPFRPDLTSVADGPEGMLGVPAAVSRAPPDAPPAAARPPPGAPPAASDAPADEDKIGADFFMLKRKIFEENRRRLLDEARKSFEATTGKNPANLPKPENPEMATLANLADTGKDVNREEVAASLEDAGLVAHMHYARDEYRNQMNKTSEMRSESAVRGDMFKVLGKLSDIIKGLKGVGTDQNVAADEVEIVGRHLTVLMDGRAMPPHFESPISDAACVDPVLRGVMHKTRSLLEKNAETLHGVTRFLEKHLNELAGMRSNVVRVTDEMVELCASQRQTIEAQNRVLQMFNPVLYRQDLKEAQEFSKFHSSMARATSKLAASDAAAKNGAPPADADAPPAAADAPPADADAPPATADAPPADADAPPAAADAPPADAK